MMELDYLAFLNEEFSLFDDKLLSFLLKDEVHRLSLLYVSRQED